MNTARRVVAILNYLASVDASAGITEISEQLNLAKASVYRVLSSLEGEGWVTKNATTLRYSLSSRIIELGLSMLSRLSLQSVSLPYLEQIGDTIGETATLSIRVDFERIYVYQVPGKYDVQLVVSLGRRLPLWAGAVGKAILAHLKDPEIEHVIHQLEESGISTLPSGRFVNTQRLRKELEEIRAQGYAVTIGERTIGACALAAPIFDFERKVIGAFGVVGLSPRFDIDVAKSYGNLIRKTAESISLQIGAGHQILDKP